MMVLRGLGVHYAPRMLFDSESIHYTGGFDSECPELLLCCSGTWDASRFTTLVGSNRGAPSYYPGARGLGMPRAPMMLFHRRAGSPEPTRRPSERRRAASESSILIAPSASPHVRRCQSAPCAAATPPRRARRCPSRAQLTAAPYVTAPAHPSRHDDRASAAEPRASRRS